MNQPDSKAANAAKPHGDLKTLPMAEVERQLASTPNGLTDVVTVYRPGFTEMHKKGSLLIFTIRSLPGLIYAHGHRAVSSRVGRDLSRLTQAPAAGPFALPNRHPRTAAPSPDICGAIPDHPWPSAR